MIDALLRRVGRAGLRRGVSGEHWAWLAIALAAFVLRRARRPVDDSVVLPIRAGESYQIHLADPADQPDA